MDRRSILKLGLATIAIPMTLVACDDGGSEVLDDDIADTGTADTCDTAAAGDGTSDTHSHVLTIPAADLAGGLGGTYTSTAGDHTHDVVLTAQDMSDLLDNCTVTVSSDDTHPHTWTLALPAT